MTDTGRNLREIVRRTVLGSVGILAQGGSDLDVMVPDFVDDVV